MNSLIFNASINQTCKTIRFWLQARREIGYRTDSDYENSLLRFALGLRSTDRPSYLKRNKNLIRAVQDDELAAKIKTELAGGWISSEVNFARC